MIAPSQAVGFQNIYQLVKVKITVLKCDLKEIFVVYADAKCHRRHLRNRFSPEGLRVVKIRQLRKLRQPILKKFVKGLFLRLHETVSHLLKGKCVKICPYPALRLRVPYKTPVPYFYRRLLHDRIKGLLSVAENKLCRGSVHKIIQVHLCRQRHHLIPLRK